MNYEQYHELYKKMEYQRMCHNEQGDCGVKALAIAASIEYELALHWLTKLGRVPRKGTPLNVLEAAMDRLGIRYYKHYPKAREHGGLFTNKTIGRVLPRGRHMVGNKTHILALIDGVAIDWSADTAKRVKYAYTLLNV